MAWVVVVGTDPVSEDQLQACRALRPAQVPEYIQCTQDNRHSEPICLEVTEYPTFCHVGRNVCLPTPGLRDTVALFDELDGLTPLP